MLSTEKVRNAALSFQNAISKQGTIKSFSNNFQRFSLKELPNRNFKIIPASSASKNSHESFRERKRAVINEFNFRVINFDNPI